MLTDCFVQLIASFNCRSVKHSWYEVTNLYNRCDVVRLQEHWLFPDEFGFLNSISLHDNFICWGSSAIRLTR